LRGEDLQRDGFVNRLRAVFDPQLAEDSVIVPFNSVQGQEEAFAYFAIGKSLGNQLEYFYLTLTQRFKKKIES